MALDNQYSYVYEDNPEFSETYVNTFIDSLGKYGLPQEVVDRILFQNFGAPKNQPTEPSVVNTITNDSTTSPLSQIADSSASGNVTASASKPAEVNSGALRQATDSSEVQSNASAETAGNVLSGNVLAGASWHSLNPTLADQLTEATGQSTLNTAVGGATTAETLKQLNDFTAAGGSFAPGSNVFLQTGGLDLVYGVDKNEIESNIDQIVSALENQGVNVVLTGSPYASSFDKVVSNDFDPQLDSIYTNIANRHNNVSLVDVMGSILQNKDLLSDFIHPNTQGWQVYNNGVLNALNTLLSRNSRTTDQG